MTKTEIINETVKFYSEDPNRRAIEGSSCLYYYRTESGVQKCAVGRCLIKPGKTQDGGVFMVFGDSCNLNKALKPKYRGHSLEFWEDLQAIHDSHFYWDEKGLSDRGKIAVEKMLEKYKN